MQSQRGRLANGEGKFHEQEAGDRRQGAGRKKNRTKLYPGQGRERKENNLAIGRTNSPSVDLSYNRGGDQGTANKKAVQAQRDKKKKTLPARGFQSRPNPEPSQLRCIIISSTKNTGAKEENQPLWSQRFALKLSLVLPQGPSLAELVCAGSKFQKDHWGYVESAIIHWYLCAALSAVAFGINTVRGAPSCPITAVILPTVDNESSALKSQHLP